MNMEEFERRMREHSESILSSFDLRTDIGGKELGMKNKRNIIARTAIVAAAVLLVLSSTAFAAYKYLSAYEVAEELDKPELAEYFKNDPCSSEAVTDGDYRAALLGVASGKELNDLKLGDDLKGRTYAVVAAERTDGADMSYDDSGHICVSPLIEGYKPWQLNIATMNGGYTEKIIDGVMYRMIECDDIECFADRKIYIAVSDETFISGSTYSFDEKSGEISENPAYDGTNILFGLKLDASLADREKAEEYIGRLRDEKNILDSDSPAQDAF